MATDECSQRIHNKKLYGLEEGWLDLQTGKGYALKPYSCFRLQKVDAYFRRLGINPYGIPVLLAIYIIIEVLRMI